MMVYQRTRRFLSSTLFFLLSIEISLRSATVSKEFLLPHHTADSRSDSLGESSKVELVDGLVVDDGTDLLDGSSLAGERRGSKRRTSRSEPDDIVI
jgi:hypothetical protein